MDAILLTDFIIFLKYIDNVCLISWVPNKNPWILLHHSDFNATADGTNTRIIIEDNRKLKCDLFLDKFVANTEQCLSVLDKNK